MAKKRYAIQYRYPGTVNGEPVGLVFALDISHLSGRGSWSYTKIAADATLFDDDDEALTELRRHRWPEAVVVSIVDR